MLSYAGSSAALRLPSISARQDFWCEVPAINLITPCTIREGLCRHCAEAPGQDRFLRGWLNRLNDLRVEAGVPGFTRKRDGGVDFGETDRIERILDLAPDALLEAWR